MPTHQFTQNFEYDYTDWSIILVLEHHRGNRITQTVGWEVLEFSIQEKSQEEGDKENRPRCDFKLPPQEEIELVRKWLYRHMISRTIDLVTAYPKDNMESHSAWLRAMLALDDSLRGLEGISNEP